MRLGLGLGLMSSTAEYNPALLFAASEPGAWYDISDLSTLFQDTAGTVPAVVGQTVARVNDKSTNGVNATQATAASRPILRQNGTTGKYYLEFDGVDDFLVTPSIDFTGTDKMTVWAGVRKLSDATRAVVAELGNNPGSNTFQMNAPFDATGTSYRWTAGGTLIPVADKTSAPAPVTSVLTGTADIAGNQSIIRYNGTVAATAPTSLGTGNFLAYPLYIGRRGGTSLPFNGHIYGLIVRGAASSAAQITQTERWMNSRAGAY